MKTLLTLLLLSISLLGQRDTTFIDLKGFEDSTGTTQLFYSTKSSKMCLINWGFNKYVDSTIYNYKVVNVESGNSSLITHGYKNYYPAENHIQYSLLNDIEFFDVDPSKYIYTINSLGIDPDGRIVRYELGEVGGILGTFTDLFISPQNQNIVYATAGGWILFSEDKGVNWDTFILNYRSNNDDYIQYIGISPFDQSIIYGVNLNNGLVKSSDSGKTFIEVSNLGYWNWESKLFFDTDREHIYSLTNKFHNYKWDFEIPSNIIYSVANGDSGSWSELLVSESELAFCIDDSASGRIFIAEGNEILESFDNGNTLQKLIELPHHAHGLYKKPGGDLFALTVNKTFRIGDDSIETILSKPIDHSFSYFPIELGNKWFYREQGVSYDIEPYPFDYYYKVEVTKDTVDNSGNRLFLIEGTIYDKKYWIRIDSLTGKIYRRDKIEYDEQLFYDLIAAEGDDHLIYDGIIKNVTESDTLIWEEQRYLKTFELLSLYTYKLNFVQGIGIVKKLNSFDFGYSTIKLLGCILGDTLYGDSTIVHIDNSDPLPTVLILSQNYPNPFNPSTTIEYSVPHPNVYGGKTESSKVKLIVYDNLGREAVILVDETQSPGKYQSVFDASNLSSGIYYYSLSVNDMRIVKKMILLK